MNRLHVCLIALIRNLPLLAILFLAAFGGNACKKAASKSDLKDFQLSIRTEQPISKPELDPKTGFRTETFHLSVKDALDLLESTMPNDPIVTANKSRDPFGSSPSAQPPSGPMHQAFAAIGIPFATGASANYDPEKGKLTVVQTPEAMGLIRQILEQFQSIPDSAAIRFEFYEIPALLALRLEQSAAAHFDDTPEWKALQGLLGEGDIRLLEIATLQTRSGERVKYEDGETFVYPAGSQDKDEEGKSEAVELFEERLVGTIIEADLVVGADAYTMNLNFALEYHSAPPEWIPTSNGPYSSDIPPATVFHMKKLLTNITIHDGQTRLLTSWTPTGKPEYVESDKRILVFVSANLQRGD